MNDVQHAALAMGIELPLFPTLAYLTCAGCAKRIETEAHDSDDGWLCDDCDAATEEGAEP